MSSRNRSKNLGKQSIRQKIEELKRAQLTSKKIIKFDDIRNLAKSTKLNTILIVDDDEIIRNGLRRILENEGYQVLVAEDGLGLSQAMDRGKIDFIFLDIKLPWVDGYELCKLIKTSSDFSKVPITLMSGAKTQVEVELAFQAGCDQFLSKPFNIDHLLDIVASTLLNTNSI